MRDQDDCASSAIFGPFIDETLGLPLEVAAKEEERAMS
jgi:hypothetical protein